MCARLLVDNLPAAVRENDIEDMFSMYGSVLSVYLRGAWETKSASTFALVDMHNAREAELAIRHINNTVMGGRTVSVMLSRQGNGMPQHEPLQDLQLAS